MPLEKSIDAIGAVGTLLKNQLILNTSVGAVDVGRPELAAGASGPRLNLFLYQVDFDGQLKNFALDEGQAPPLWLVLRYLLTAVDSSKESDSIIAHELLGESMLVLSELNFIASDVDALADNPEPLKITFDPTDAELLAKIMQGSEDKYRLSVGFQVRPVMIASGAAPTYSLPVQTVGPPPDEGVVVLPYLGPKLHAISPEKFTAGEEVRLTGGDIGTEIEHIRLGSTPLAVTAARSGEVRAVIPIDTTLSPGSYPVTAVRGLPDGKTLYSNAVLGQLLPTLVDATPASLTHAGGAVSGNLTLTGDHLGGPEDQIVVAFYAKEAKGRVALMLHTDGIADQSSLIIEVVNDDKLSAGDYFIILRVNGAQATHAPEVDWS